MGWRRGPSALVVAGGRAGDVAAGATARVVPHPDVAAHGGEQLTTIHHPPADAEPAGLAGGCSPSGRTAVRACLGMPGPRSLTASWTVPGSGPGRLLRTRLMRTCASRSRCCRHARVHPARPDTGWLGRSGTERLAPSGRQAAGSAPEGTGRVAIDLARRSSRHGEGSRSGEQRQWPLRPAEAASRRRDRNQAESLLSNGARDRSAWSGTASRGVNLDVV
jgi:hypothetical protein